MFLAPWHHTQMPPGSGRGWKGKAPTGTHCVLQRVSANVRMMTVHWTVHDDWTVAGPGSGRCEPEFKWQGQGHGILDGTIVWVPPWREEASGPRAGLAFSLAISTLAFL